jgi:hypothetical protein
MSTVPPETEPVENPPESPPPAKAPRKSIKDQVVEVLQQFGILDDEGEPVEDEPVETVEDTSVAPTTDKQVEADLESKVRAALQGIRNDEEREAVFNKAKELVERAPRQFSRLTKALWGSDG